MFVQIIRLPMENVSQQSRCLVVQIMTGGHHVIVLLNRHAVELIPFHGSTRGARGTTDEGCQFPDAGPLFPFHRMNVERRLIRRGDGLSEPLDFLSGLKGILANAQVHVQGVGAVAEFQQDAPQGEAVFAAGHGHEHAVVGRQHPVSVNGPTNLGMYELRKAIFAQGDIVPGHFDDRGVRTFPAAHGVVIPRK